MEDHDDATIEDVRECFRIYYAPNNGVIGERRGPSSLYVFAIPKPGHSTDAIRSTIQEEIKRLAMEGPSPDEMEKLRNTLLNDTVRNRQSTLYRAQRLAEFTLYDGDSDIVNTELERYLAVTTDEIKSAVSRFLLTDNHSVIEVVPAHMADAEEKPAPAQAPPPGEPAQPGAPPPQVPPPPPADPAPPTKPPPVADDSTTKHEQVSTADD